MKESCKHITDMLVDYADGELSAAESRQVSEHLGECENCRTSLDALRKSLDLADAIWQDGLSQMRAVEPRVCPAPRKARWIRYVAVAAAILLVGMTSVIWHRMDSPPKNQPTLVEIERTIAEAGSAARLLAATDLLAEYSDTEAIAKRQYRYILDTYPHTPAAAKAKLRIE